MPRVLYIAGAERSGTTILGNVLATAPGVEHVGELEYLGKPRDIAGQQCGCSHSLVECPFWKEVVATADIDLARWQRLRKSTTRIRHAPRILYDLKRHGRTFEYAQLLDRLYSAVGNQGVSVVVDSSKRAGGALSAIAAPGAETSVIHIVRDPRAVAYSRAKRTKRHGAHGEGAELVRRSVLETSRQWLACNTEIELVRRLAVPEGRFLRVRYEDLMSDPKKKFFEIATWLGINQESLAFHSRSGVSLRQTHTVKGNPIRFSTGDTQLTLDEEWRTGLSRKDRASCASVCLPLMIRYGYKVGA